MTKISTTNPATATTTNMAKFHGEAITELPKNLYVPPDALEIFLEVFEGPLDLLLYLIQKNNLDIVNIPVATITQQYMYYINLMEELNLELAAEYLLMAAMLAEIKSRILLPRSTSTEEEGDPRAELIQRLQQYERFKKAAEELWSLPQLGRDTFSAQAQSATVNMEKPKPQLLLDELFIAFAEVMKRTAMQKHHRIIGEPLSVRERMSLILTTLSQQKFVPFHQLFKISEGKQGVIVTFIAILELLKGTAIELVQSESFAPIHIKQASNYHE